MKYYLAENGHTEEALEAAFGDPELADLYVAKEWLESFPAPEMRGDTTEMWAEVAYLDVEDAIKAREVAVRQKAAAVLDGEGRHLSQYLPKAEQPPQNS